MRCLVTAPNVVESSASVFTSLLAGDCPATPLDGRTSRPLTARPCLAITGHHLLSQASTTHFRFIIRLSHKSQSYVTTDGQSTSPPWCQANIWGPRPDFCYCQTVAGLLLWGTLSDERMGVPFTITSGPRQRSHTRGTHMTFYCLGFETPPTWRARSPYLYPRGTGWPSYTPRHWVPFSSPPTTCRVTVEVFELASTQGPLLSRQSQSQSNVTTGGLPPISSSWGRAP
jgi:hypothetical protein